MSRDRPKRRRQQFHEKHSNRTIRTGLSPAPREITSSEMAAQNLGTEVIHGSGLPGRSRRTWRLHPVLPMDAELCFQAPLYLQLSATSLTQHGEGRFPMFLRLGDTGSSVPEAFPKYSSAKNDNITRLPRRIFSPEWC